MRPKSLTFAFWGIFCAGLLAIFIALALVGRGNNVEPATTPAHAPTSTAVAATRGSGVTSNDPIPCAMWPADNIWNRRVDALPTQTLSGDFVTFLGSDNTLSNGFGSRTWHGYSLGQPYNVVPTSQPLVNIDFTQYADMSDPGPYPYPTSAAIQGATTLVPVPNSGDRHVSVLRAGDCTLFETWHSQPDASGAWSAANGAVFHLTSNDLRPDGWTSAEAAGFAILPALLRYDEVASGTITHAIRFTGAMSSIRDTFVWPARHTDGTSHSDRAPPMGTRFRLKASIDISAYPLRLRTILQGLKTYGMFLADSGDSWQIDGATDQRWNDDELQQLQRIHGSDFEAVDLSGLMIDPNSAQSR